MKKYKLIRQSKKVLAAVLAVSLMMTSVAPGAVYASETEMTETVVQTEESTKKIAIQSEEDSAQTAVEQESDPAQTVAGQEADPETASENDEVEVDFQSEDEQENSEKMEVQEQTETEATVQVANDDAEVSDVNASPVTQADNDNKTQPFDITVSMVTQLRYGYTSTNQSQIYVSNGTGKIDSNRRCWLEGEDKDAFECYPATSTNSIWYIKPKVGLTARTYTAALHANYLGEEATKEISLTVLPRTVYVKWGDHEFTYDKKEHVPEVTVNGSSSILKGDTCNLIVKGSQTNAGTYTATVETDNPCYKIYSSQETQSFTINPRPVEFEWDYEDGHVFEYDGNPHTLTATATGVLEGDTCNPVYQEMTLDTSTPGTTGPKHCTVTITGVDNSNYTTKHGQQLYVSRAFNVVAKKITKKIILNPKKAKQYDGTTTFPTSSSYYDYADGAFTSEIDGLVGDDKVYVSAIQSKSATLDNKDVGTDKALTLNVYLAGKDKYKYDFTGIQVAGTTIVQATGTATVDPRPVTLQWDKDKFQYDGNEHTPVAKITNGVLSGENCNINSIAVSGKNLTNGKAVNAGTYTATATLDNSNYIAKVADKEFIIEKADSVVKVAQAANLIYNRKTQNLISSGQTNDGKLVYKVNGGEWSETIPTGLDAGTYEISYKVVGDDNHKDSAEVQLTVNIAKKAVVVSGITAEDKTYDGNTRAVLNYDGVKFDGLLEKDSLSVTAEGTFENKNAGQKKVLVSNLTLDGASAKNYVLADDQQSETTATIKAKEITAVITPNGGTYEGTITPATAVLNGLEGEDNPEITLTYTGIANDGTEADGTVPTHAGTYTVTASIVDENYSLKAEGASAEFVVAKADPALSVSAVADKSYGEEPFKLETSNKGEGQKTYTSSDEKVITVDENGLVTIIGAGEATLTVSLTESANYNAVTETVTVTVLPKAVTVTQDSLTKVYDEADPELTYKVKGLVGKDTLTDITIARAEGENAGTYDITAEAKEGSNPNYSITFEKGSFTITQKPIDTAEVTLGDALKYTGKEQIQNVAKVTLDGKEIPADAYTVENNTATEAGTYTLTIRAKENGNYTGALTWTYVIAPKQDGQSKSAKTEKKSGTTGTSQTTAVETGDTTNVAGYGMTILISAMALAVILQKRRRRTEK